MRIRAGNHPARRRPCEPCPGSHHPALFQTEYSVACMRVYQTNSVGQTFQAGSDQVSCEIQRNRSRFVLLVIRMAAVKELATANPHATHKTMRYPATKASSIAWRAKASSVSMAASLERCAST